MIVNSQDHMQNIERSPIENATEDFGLMKFLSAFICRCLGIIASAGSRPRRTAAARPPSSFSSSSSTWSPRAAGCRDARSRMHLPSPLNFFAFFNENFGHGRKRKKNPINMIPMHILIYTWGYLWFGMGIRAKNH